MPTADVKPAVEVQDDVSDTPVLDVEHHPLDLAYW
jgi:hypothetical protein